MDPLRFDEHEGVDEVNQKQELRKEETGVHELISIDGLNDRGLEAALHIVISKEDEKRWLGLQECLDV